MLPAEGFDVRSGRNHFRGERDVLFWLGFHQQPRVFSGEPFHIFATARESTELDPPMLERVHFKQNHLYTFDECLVQRSDDRPWVAPERKPGGVCMIALPFRIASLWFWFRS